MGSFLSAFESRKVALGVPAAVLFVGVIAEFVAILSLNGGHLTYTLDDAYIHLSLAENILSGHYGVNAGEFSSPASSILWPFVLAPLMAFVNGDYLPLILNTIAAAATIYLFFRFLEIAFADWSAPGKYQLIALLLLALIPASNLIGLIYTGMEHSAQLLLTTATLLGIVLESRDGNVRRWLIAVIIIAPLVRYENLAISGPALLYLFLRRHYVLSVATGAAMLVPLVAFSLFLDRLDLSVVPASVLLKSSLASDGDRFGPLRGFINNLYHPRGQWLLLISFGFLLLAASRKRSAADRIFAASMAAGLLLHAVFGQFGWYNRYEIYAWTAALLAIIFLQRDYLARLWDMSPLKIVVLVMFCVIVFCRPYLATLVTTPIAANNLYEQQYQLHRFITEYYKRPVAVNDLGYPTYRNPDYVLDLYGLGSLEAQAARKSGADPDWMNRLARKHDVDLALLYSPWFEVVPENWQKIAELQIGRRRITPAYSTVTVYALDAETPAEVLPLLEEFRATLPPGVALRIL